MRNFGLMEEREGRGKERSGKDERAALRDPRGKWGWRKDPEAEREGGSWRESRR